MGKRYGQLGIEERTMIQTQLERGIKPAAILNRNEPTFYCVPAKAYEALMDKLEDMQLNTIADARLKDGKKLVQVKLDEL